MAFDAVNIALTTPLNGTEVASVSRASRMSMLIDHAEKKADAMLKLARKVPGGQYSSMIPSCPSPSGPSPLQLCTQDRKGKVPASTPPVSRSRNPHE
jgi:hypothetical protein